VRVTVQIYTTDAMPVVLAPVLTQSHSTNRTIGIV